MKKYINQFWGWYEERLHINIGVAAFLFSWQLAHLFWLTTDIVFERLLSVTVLNLSGIWEYLIIAADYTEIPVIIAVSLIYLNELRQGRDTGRSLLFLILLNSQWLHLFWITDEFIINKLRETGNIILPFWLVWFAISVDYLELPVIYDTLKKFLIFQEKNNGPMV